MEFKGTKGKLKVVKVINGLAKGFYLSGENQTYFIAQIITYGRSGEENLANATLFSKAPEMLEMLKELKDRFEYFNDNVSVNEIEQLIKESTEL